ncbi:MAG TPA: SBBP repeat-containing protein, partial [Bacteroidia bacterium]|nr:SBBP repeat-containing protein [Bacteroidia bacterium]
MGLNIKKIILICICLLTAIYTDAQLNYKYAKSIGHSGEDYGTSIAVDNSGNSYVMGTFNGTVDFDPGAGVQNIAGGGMFCAKYDSLGNYVWAFGITTTTSFKSNYKLVLDASSNVYITGIYTNDVDFDPSADSAYLTTPLS